MPDEDGYSLVRKLRKLAAGENLVAIAVTGYASQGDIEAAIDAGSIRTSRSRWISIRSCRSFAA